ncbi:DUF5590 domain-containing protein [Heyndrickxia oleronia]|uniref:DUF5590 domain-containing protein n=1 Tax=Heyndrickxia oleronia TaxID=38875 RepID=A0AAW6SMB5_9BACI|nr:DUF5590 domain-containing protein [Heyndrickxia oleronia]MDH5159911.1 DUF5590 domain-containing protein [Heyndrickxia oleronia]
MKKWIIIAGLCILVIVGISVNVYFQSMKPISHAKDFAEKKAREKANLTSMDQFYLYNGDITYYVAVGKQKNGKKVAVWIPEKNSDQITIEKWSDGISKSDAINTVMKKEKPAKVLGSRLGMLDKEPVWEISYLDHSSRLNYAYVYFLKANDKTPYMITNI